MTTYESCHFRTVGTPWRVQTADTLIKRLRACVLLLVVLCNTLISMVLACWILKCPFAYELLLTN